ncbi:pyridoxamine 5'-phosphate oxidase family protein [Micromonospora cathayae]|uniref:Pyridoxamine 5'-phosphate oxidase family protein n=1 Tax=Micromonospora cathayae TaxID=3028804 RepID=A0ABY7ZQS5_9ACTN|nr:pyridoxamine 5'-phosphate oxidase family protein [Micromonospora sp. HUAS 3]WDZ84219.1 pyridoxamine 5'-phosphate oxidase family protein [Micromonospora sp. HUAS 3]
MSALPDPLVAGSPLAATLDAYRTCELVTVGRDGSPAAWPTSGMVRADGTILLTTSIGYPQKAFNVRREPRVALLFSDPTGSGLTDPAQILVRGVADCPDQVHTDPTGELADFWARMFARQPKCRGYLDWPATTVTDFYFMRLLITVAPTEVSTRPLPPPAAPPADTGLVGGRVLAAYPTVVLAARDDAGAPVLVRTTASAEETGFRVAVPDDVPVAAGSATLLVHRHDEKLWNLHNANVRGDLVRDDDGWLLRPTLLVEPGARHRSGPFEPLRTLRTCRTTTRRYLAYRHRPRPAVPWSAYRAIRATVTG